eukprot:622140-Pleurochrysis_carterae.AAC.5
MGKQTRVRSLPSGVQRLKGCEVLQPGSQILKCSSPAAGQANSKTMCKYRKFVPPFVPARAPTSL